MRGISNETFQDMSREAEARKQRGRLIVIAYPFALLGICVALNFFVLGIEPLNIALPAKNVVVALVIAGALLLINHTWLMTATELTRGRFDLFATPEEWQASGRSREEAAPKGLTELERHHNAHRNSTENTVYFVFLALILGFATPSDLAAYVWIIGFGIARLGYTFSYLTGRDGLRGLFMSLSLLSLYGIASYLVLSVLIGA